MIYLQRLSVFIVLILIASLPSVAFDWNCYAKFQNNENDNLLKVYEQVHNSVGETTSRFANSKDTIKNKIFTGKKENVTDAPVVDFSFTNNNTCAGTSIKFTSNVTGGTKPYKEYKWNFGDGRTSSEENPTIKFNSLGCTTETFKVKLTVTDADDNHGNKEKTVSVKQLPNISFIDVNDDDRPFNNCKNASIIDPSYTITVGNTSPSKACINSYSIDWGDGSSTNDATFPIDHEYKELGAFNMVITAKGSNGCDNDIPYLVANQTNPSVGINSPGETIDLCAPTDELDFTISNWGLNSPGTTYLVEYGDGIEVTVTQEEMVASSYYNSADPASSANYPVPHSYAISSCPDDYFTVNVTARNACSSSGGTVKPITVITKPVPNFTAPSACVNTSVLFSNTTTIGNGVNCKETADFTWDFGDGSPIVEQKKTLPKDISHTYSTPGVYDVTLTATNNKFCGGNSITKKITISAAPTGTISGGAEVCVGDASPVITFTGADSNPPYTFTYRINSGPSQSVKTQAGNSSVTIDVPTNSPGNFTYTLLRVGALSCSQSQTGTAVIIVNGAVTATITGTTDVCLNDAKPQITFTGDNGTAPYTFTYNINGGTDQTITTTSGNSVTVEASTDVAGVFQYNLLGVKDAGTNSCSEPQTGSATITINDKPAKPNPISDLEYCNGDATSIISFSNNVAGTTFEWTNSNTDIGLAASGTGDISSFTTQNTSTSPILSTITVIATNNGCNSESQSFTITVNPSPSVTFSEGDQTICSGETTTKVLLSTSSPGADLSWTTTQPLGISETIKLSGTDVIESQPLTNTTNSSIEIEYRAKATLSGATTCPGAEYVYTVTVDPEPFFLNSFKDTICSGESFALSPKNSGGNIVPAETKYTWENPVISPVGAITGASEETTPQSTISQLLVNTSTVIATATYSITPVSKGCKGGAFDLVVYVIPGATLPPISDITLCDEEINPEIDFGTPPQGVKYKWSTDNAGIGLPGKSGEGNIPEFKAINKGASPITATITVTPEGDFGDADCGGTPIEFKITVDPKASVSGNLSDTICSSATLSFTPKNGGGNIIPAGTKYTWSNPVIKPAGSITGASEETIPQSEINQTLANTSDLIATATYTVTPISNNCTGEVFELIVYVIPGATLSPVNDIILCNGEENPEIDFGTPPQGTIFKWSSDNDNIGLPGTSGTGNIPKFTAINNGTFPAIATITVTPEGDFGDSDCGGTPINFSIMVNPTGKVDNPGDYTTCSGDTISIDFITVNTGGTTTFEWTNSNTDIGLKASGSGDILFTGINTKDSTLTSVVTVTPIFTNGGVSCNGVPIQFYIRVNPIPLVDQPLDQTVCNGNNTSEVIFTGDIPSAEYYWSVNDTSIGIPPNGMGNIPEFTAINNESDSVVAIITVVPKFKGCDGTPKNFKIVVYPSAVILKQPSSSTVCLGEKPVTLSVVHTSGVNPPLYQWYSNTSNSTIGGTIIEHETNSSYDPPAEHTINMYYYCVITFSNGGCGNLTTDIVRVRVNPNPYIILNNEEISRDEELKMCEGDSLFIHVTGAETYLWNEGVPGDTFLLRDIGAYRVIGISDVGCKDTFNFSASYYDLMYYTVQSDISEITNAQTQVHFWSEDIASSFYTWDFDDGLTGYGYDIYHSFDIKEDGYFDVRLDVINPHGCKENAIKRIWTSIKTIANTFTPNGDGINDFYLKGWKIEIYNRNGILLYEGKDGWDGSYKGKPVANDTYFVIIYDSSEQGTKYKTSFVTVIR